ncbi:MAG: S8 family serine peptidase [Myxococcaceae bacterium]|nr:S8 family serine peptidase [Myxococcaceae bacterium]
MKTRYTLMPGLIALCACSTLPPSSEPKGADATLTLNVPQRVIASADAPARFTVLVSGSAEPVRLTIEGAPAGVTTQLDQPETTTSSVVTVKVEAGTSPMTAELTVRATVGTVEAKKSVRLDVVGAPKLPTRAPEISVTLDQLFYAAGQRVEAVVDFGALTPPSTVTLFLSSTDSRDAERLVLERGPGNTFRTAAGVPTSALTTGEGAPNDGTLQLHPGDSFYALYFVDPSLPNLEVGLVSDLAFLDGPARAETPTHLDSRLALTPDEASAMRPIATLLRKNELPLQLAARELIATPSSQRELDRIVALTGGRVVDQQPVGLDGTALAYLLEVPTERVTAERLSIMRHFVGELGELASSRPEGLGVYALALAARLEGLPVTVNPRLGSHAAPTTIEGEPPSDNMRALGRAGDTGPCLPGADAGNPCVRNAPALWTWLSLMDRDTERVRVGVLDYGFAPNADFRPDADGGFRECDMTGGAARCAPGAARAAPNAGAFGGDRVWHGTGSVTALGGVVNDGFGGAGTGGQVAVPMMYRYDNLNFVFNIGRGVRQAVNDGASVINISAGYPCSVAVNVGPDLDLCTVAGRAAICAVVSFGVLGAAALVCQIDPLLSCAVANGIAATAVTACVGTLQTSFALGDPRDPMRSGIVYAKSRGVPVVVSAGNAYPSSVLPDVIRDYVNLNDRNTSRWGVVPASFPEVITVGAVNTALDNQEFLGPRVDVWAPIFTRYARPSTDDPASATVFDTFSGTSDAAPYTTGVVAAMQAANPRLNPATTTLTAEERRTLTERVKALLRDTAWTNSQLVSYGYQHQPTERPRLLNPLGAVKAAARGALPDLLALGYDDQLNFEEHTTVDDLPSQARVISVGSWVTGSIVGIPAVRLASPPTDVDSFRVRGVTSGREMVSQELRLRVLAGVTELPVLVVDRALVQFERVSTTRLGDAEWELVYRFFTREPDLTFGVTAAPGDDFAYRLRLEPPVRATPSVRITEPAVAMSRICVGQSFALNGRVSYPPTTFTETMGRWLIDGVVVRNTADRFTPTFTTAGLRRIVLESGGAMDSITVEAVPCSVFVRMATPGGNVADYPSGSNSYLSVPLGGELRDVSGNLLPTAGYTFEWVTDRADAQPGGPTSGTQVVATGSSATGLFYAVPGEAATEHRLVLIVRQGGVEVGRSITRLITVLQLI